jgi:hypothetical protein
MRKCHVCGNKWPDEVEICPEDHVPLALDRAAARLHLDPYSAHPHSIETMESTLRNLEEVLAVSPNHDAAARVKERIERVLRAAEAQSDYLFRSVEEKFAAGDLVGCLEIFVANPALRKKQAKDLRRRVRRRIAEGAKTNPDDERAPLLAEQLFGNLVDYFVEGLGGIDWLEELSYGLSEVLFLCPAHVRAAAMKKDIDSGLVKGREESAKLFRTGEAMIETGDFAGCLDLLRRSELIRIQRSQAEELRRRSREKVMERIQAEPNNAEWKALLREFSTHWLWGPGQ